jgi:two-component system response regulator DesR
VTVERGRRLREANAAESLSTGAGPLTRREREVLRLSLRGGTAADMAAELHLTEGTVRNHLSTAIGKLGARNRSEAARLAEDRGWL